MNELEDLFAKLIVNNKPTKEYIEMVCAQREWLVRFGTTKARAGRVMEILNAQIL